MQLPPESPNEPEWLVVQRANKAADRQFVLAFGPMQAVLAASVVPLMLITPSWIVIAIYGAIVMALCLTVLRPRTTARTVGRYIVNYVAIAWGVFVVAALFASAISLLAAP